MYLSPERRLVKPIIQSLVDVEIVLQPLTKGGHSNNEATWL